MVSSSDGFSAPTPRVPLTYREYCYLPEDGRRYELMEGELYGTPAPTPFHQTVSRRLQYALMTALEETGIAFVFDAPIDVILSDITVVQPDLAILATARKHLVTGRGIEGPPEVVVEILSPGTSGRDRHLKSGIYARHGIREYWIVDSDHGWIEVFGPTADGSYALCHRFDRADTLRSGVFAEIAVPMAPLFHAL